MYDHALRRPKEALYLPLAKKLSISPNTLTALGLASGLLSAVFCAFACVRLALLFWLINRFLDGLDGEVARAQNTQSDLGGYLDILADLLIYAFIPLGLALSHNDPSVWFGLAFMLSSFYLNVGSWMYLSSILEKRGQGAAFQGERTSVSMPRGLIEGGETVLFFTLFVAFPERSALLFMTFAVLTFLGAGLRVRWASRALSQV